MRSHRGTHVMGMAVLALALAGAAGCHRPPAVSPESPPAAEVDQRIAFHERQVATAPRLYPAKVELAAAYLDKASVTHDPSWLARARSALGEALTIQPTYEAFLVQTRLANHTHRFSDALAWGSRAAAASVNGAGNMDPMLVPALVEAHLGLGQDEQAGQLLPEQGDARYVNNHHLAVAQGHWLAAQRRTDEAVAAFRQAAALARTEPDLMAWAEVRAAGALLDNDRPGEAVALLTDARRLDPRSTLLRLHEAELAVAQGDPRAALALYQEVLAGEPSPDVHAAAFALARQIGDHTLARSHFEAAEAGYRRAITVGEVYTLGGLAQLYLTAEVNLDEALRLAERNLQYRRDPSSHTLVASLRARVAGPDGTSL